MIRVRNVDNVDKKRECVKILKTWCLKRVKMALCIDENGKKFRKKIGECENNK